MTNDEARLWLKETRLYDELDDFDREAINVAIGAIEDLKVANEIVKTQEQVIETDKQIIKNMEMIIRLLKQEVKELGGTVE